MKPAASETLRIEALERYRIFDSKDDETLDALARLAADICGTPIAFVSLVDRDRNWFLSHVGIEASEAPQEISYCRDAIERPDDITVVNVEPSGEPSIRFYAGMPIKSSDGFALGTLCVIDRVAHVFTAHQERSLRTLAGQVETVLESRREVRELRGRLDQRVHAEANFQRIVAVDPATGAANRRSVLEIVESTYARLQANPHMRVAIVLIGVEGVKIVDDSIGHGAGDALMTASVERIIDFLPRTESVARYGDCQILVLLDDSSAAAASDVAGRILELFARPFEIGEQSLRMRANIGVTVTDGTHQRAADLVRDASSAMYHSKTLGEGTFALFTPALREIACTRLRLEGELRRAIEGREFRLHFQPVVSLPTSKLVGFEALIRWQHPERGLIMPDQFISVAEETGLIEPIGEWVIREGCRQLGAWQRAYPGYDELALSVNVSAIQFRNEGLFEIVTSALADAQLDPRCLQIEITETALMEQSDFAVETLDRLRDFGVAAHLDDFGCGFSTLNYLKRFAVTTLKIDRSFISGGPGPGISHPEIVRAVIALATTLRVKITAEGIETREQLDELQAYGCAHGQGYFISKPLSQSDVERFLSATCGKRERPAYNVLAASAGSYGARLLGA
jgi:diguanylate cyclase (GGDEF)-like protein